MKKIIFLLLMLPLVGCAVGNKYQYQNANVSLPVKGNMALAVHVDDERSYVKSGDKPANFVGLQRGGFGNPFNVTTGSDKPLADDVLKVLISGLNKRGFSASEANIVDYSKVAIAEELSSGKNLFLLLHINEWKTDVYMKVNLHYDLLLEVYDSTGKLIASSGLNGNDVISGASMSASGNSSAAVIELEKKLSYLFNDKAIKQVLR